jgi:hypothetical protein
MRLVILKKLYFIVVMWQMMWVTYMSKQFISEFFYIVIEDWPL